ncbi:capsid protein [Sea buckthorn marafivirus]|nr:capsid protein [Sea buckthorn marafivirus]
MSYFQRNSRHRARNSQPPPPPPRPIPPPTPTPPPQPPSTSQSKPALHSSPSTFLPLLPEPVLLDPVPVESALASPITPLDSSSVFDLPLHLMANVQTGQDSSAPPHRDDRFDPQPGLPLAPSLSQTSNQAPFVDVPFQWLVASLSGDRDTQTTTTLASSATLAKLTSIYRYAEIRSVELEFVPTSLSFSKPISVSAAWTIASITPAAADEMDYYGGRFLTVGGPVLLSSTTHIPCPLNSINPTIKTSVSYSDTPRFTFTARAVSGGSANAALALVIIRGVVRLSGPSGGKFT